MQHYPTELHRLRHRRNYWTARVQLFRAEVNFYAVATEYGVAERHATQIGALKNKAAHQLKHALQMRTKMHQAFDAARKRQQRNQRAARIAAKIDAAARRAA